MGRSLQWLNYSKVGGGTLHLLPSLPLSPLRSRPLNPARGPGGSGVVSGTTVRALVLGHFSQKKIKNRIER